MLLRTRRAALACALVFSLAHAHVQEHSGPAPTVVVTATRLPLAANELLNDLTVIERPEIEASGAGSLGELLAALSGLQFVSNGAGQASSLFLRGAESRHTVVLIDGMRLNSATLGETAIQHLPLAQIERIEIARGPVSSLYGSEAIGGVVHIFTRRPADAPQRYLSASLGSRGSGIWRHAFTVGAETLDQGSVVVNPRHWAHDPDSDRYRRAHLSGHAELQLAAGHRLAARLFASESDSRYDSGPSLRETHLRQSLRAVSLEAKNRLAEGWISTLRLSDSADDATDRSDYASVFRTVQTQRLTTAASAVSIRCSSAIRAASGASAAGVAAP